MALRRGSQHTFSQVPSAEIPRSSFSRSHGYKATFDAGLLIPFYADEVLPGDSFSLNVNMFARLATPVKPLMDNMVLDVFFFFVPNRLVWDNWVKFCGEQRNPGDSTDYLIPETTAATIPELSLFDYLGCPVNIAGVKCCALWPRAYNLIWNEWFRDQNMQTRATEHTGDGPDPIADFPLRYRGKRHDYFTSCLPWPQKGPGVELPLGGFASVVSNTLAPTPALRNAAGTRSYTPATHALTAESGGTISPGEYVTGGFKMAAGSTNLTVPGDEDLFAWSNSGLVADMSAVSAVTINQLREAVQVQRMLERDARGGTRYTEIVRAHFKVVSPDARLQRPEFLGGGSAPVIVKPVVQTNETTATSPQGNLAAFGTAANGGRIGFTKAFTEHGVILGLVMARADVTYQQGLPRMFSRRTRQDIYWPVFAHLGEQAVLNKEIYFQGTAADDDVFGYQERFAEYRYFPDIVTGRFRSQSAATLDVWHLAQEFGSLPTLSDDFIRENPPVDRVIAVEDEPHFLFDAQFSIRAARPMPVYGVPGNLDRF